VNDGQSNWFVHSFEVVRLNLITGSISISIEKAHHSRFSAMQPFSIGRMSANFTDSGYFLPHQKVVLTLSAWRRAPARAQSMLGRLTMPPLFKFAHFQKNQRNK